VVAARIAKFALTALMFSSLFWTKGFTADFPPKDAVPISVPVYLDKRPMGTAQMLMMPDPQASYVQLAPLLAMLKSLVPADKLQALEASAIQGFVNLNDGVKGGVDLHFNELLVALIVTIPSESKRRQSLSLQRNFDVSNQTITPPSPVSAYLNVYGAQDYVDSGLPSQDEGRQPFRASAEGALNMDGWVLENSADFLEGDPHPWERDDTRLVHDFPSSLVRTALGDLSYPVQGFQSFQPMLGLTVARNFDLEPYRVSEPTGQTSFFLNSPSRVDIYVNDRKVQTLQLNSGPYDLSNFPVVNGSNNVKLVITDASGRVEVKNVDIVSDTNLLAAGLHAFAYNIGFVSSTVNRAQQYDFSQPVASVFHRYGLTNNLTLGANVQADKSQQMSGFDTTLGTDWGIARVDLAGSHLEGGADGVGWQTQYQIVDHGKIGSDGTFDGTKNFTLLADYRSPDFAPLGLLLPDNTSSYQFTARYSQQWSPTVNFGVGAGYGIGRGGQPDDQDYTVSLDKQFPAGVHLNVNVERRTVGGYGMFVNLSWTPFDSRHSVSSSYDSFSNTARTDWSYAQDNESNSFSASTGVVRTQDRYDATGNATYYGERGQVTASHDVVTPYGNNNGALNGTESRSEIRFASALVYGDGHMALSRPISDSFAIFAPDPSIKDYPIGINPQNRPGEDRTYEATTDGWGPAVLPNLTSYLYRTVRVDASKLPPGFDAGAGTYTFYPSYRSGTFVRLGSDANVLLDGTLQFKDKTPVSLQAGTVSLAGQPDAASEAFFTNRSGRFRIEKLKPGKYEMRLYGFPGVTLSLTVPEGAAGPVQAGILTLPIAADEANAPASVQKLETLPTPRGAEPVPKDATMPALGPIPRYDVLPLPPPPVLDQGAGP
jgi:outer membrane usher protein